MLIRNKKPTNFKVFYDMMMIFDTINEYVKSCSYVYTHNKLQIIFYVIWLI